jgi:pantoate--beta-alanine ligase
MSHSTSPRLVTTVSGLREAIGAVRRQGKKIGLVPTMGALHEGHLSLVRRSRAECDFTVVTIFVNPSQFGRGEDLARYPRNLDNDLELLAGSAELVFAPGDEQVYPPGYATWVELGSVSLPLEGALRPGHFRGVATVVLKLLNMVGPDVAYFGQKDFQQALVIRRLVADLNVPVEIRVCPIVREADGLAMSSRNAYLKPDERRQAVVLSRSLHQAAEMVCRGQRDPAQLEREIRRTILAAGPSQIDYIAIADPETLEPVDQVRASIVIALAVKIGSTRLIDNILIGQPSESI